MICEILKLTIFVCNFKYSIFQFKWLLFTTIENTGRAVVITSLTTIIGFGSLAFASFRAIREMGILSILGGGFCLIATLTILPATLKIWERRKRFTDFVGIEQDEIRWSL